MTGQVLHRAAGVWTLLLITGAGVLNVAHGQSRVTVFSETFTRGSGIPERVSRSFSSAPGPGRITIVNGDENGGKRVSAATITLNGVVVAGTQAFSQTVAVITREVVLGAENTLGVQLESAPGSQLRIEVLGLADSGRLLEGPAFATANSHIPDLPFPRADVTEFLHADTLGLPISTRDFLLAFSTATTVSQANALLVSIGGSVAGGLPEAQLVLVRLYRSLTPPQMLTLIDQLNSDPKVKVATTDKVLELGRIPGPSDWPNWNWIFQTGRQWGLVAVRAPQAWNLLDWAGREGRTNVAVGVLDDGIDATHPDFLATSIDVETVGGLYPNVSGGHGTSVASVIAARFGNLKAIDGINPMPKVVSLDVSPLYFSVVLDAFSRIGRSSLQIFNLSSQYPFHEAKPEDSISWRANSGEAAAIQQIEYDGLTFLQAVGGLQRSVLVFAAAGNQSDRNNTRFNKGAIVIPHTYGSPYCQASRFLPANIICVGATDVAHFPAFRAADFSNSALLFAPGDSVGVLNDGGSFTSASGTSLAAPLAAGAAAYLQAHHRRLNITDIGVALFSFSQPNFLTGGRHLDLFNVLMGIDDIAGVKGAQSRLVDVDDGSRDGNARTDDDDDDDDGDIAETYPNGIAHPDQRRGDGSVDMKDLRAFRDAVLQVDALPPALPFFDPQILSTDSISQDLREGTHFKRDLNYDGCVGTVPASPPHPPILQFEPDATQCAGAPNESRYSRYDFNGDGKANGLQMVPSNHEVTPFKTAADDASCDILPRPAGCLRDIDVLADPAFWTGTTSEEHVSLSIADGAESCGLNQGWLPTHSLLADRDSDGKIDYLLSADLHFIIGPDPSLFYDVVEIHVIVPPFWSKCIKLNGPYAGKIKKVVTVPLLSGSPVVVRMNFQDLGGNPDGAPIQPPIIEVLPQAGLKYGSDRTIVWP